MSGRTAERRMAQARRQITDDINAADRQEIVAQFCMQCMEGARRSAASNQNSNVIGFLRVHMDLLGLGSKS